MNAPCVGRFFLFPETRAELMAVSQKHREALAAKRATQAVQDRRCGERRSEVFQRRCAPSFDRRDADRRQFATMADKLAAEAHKHESERQYTGKSLTDFGAMP